MRAIALQGTIRAIDAGDTPGAVIPPILKP